MEYLIFIFLSAAIAHAIQLFCYFDYLKTHDRTPRAESGMELHHHA